MVRHCGTLTMTATKFMFLEEHSFMTESNNSWIHGMPVRHAAWFPSLDEAVASVVHGGKATLSEIPI